MPDSPLSEEELGQSLFNIATILKSANSAAASRALDKIVENYRLTNVYRLVDVMRNDFFLADRFSRLVEVNFIQKSIRESCEIEESMRRVLNGKRRFRMTTLLRLILKTCFLAVKDQSVELRPDLWWKSAIEESFEVVSSAKSVDALDECLFLVMGKDLSKNTVRS